MINFGAIKPVNVPPTDAELTAWQSRPHRFLAEAAKLSASSCSIWAWGQAYIVGRCWWCGLTVEASIHLGHLPIVLSAT